MGWTGGTTRRMTPAAHWSPDDYYRASRNARAAWERQDHQLSILSDSPALAMLGLGTGEGEACCPSSMAAAASPVPSPSSDASLSRRTGSTTPTGEEPV